MKFKRYRYNELTPVEKYGSIWFKRDDLYKPFTDFGITGGKVRQCLFLVESNLKHIRKECNSTIATAASVFSPQATIVSRIAREFGLKCIIGVGSDKPEKHRAMQICLENGAELRSIAKLGYNNVLYSRMIDLQKQEKFFLINFGYQALSDPLAIIAMNSSQTDNLPKFGKCSKLVINVGSGVSAAGILDGVATTHPEYFGKPGGESHVILIQPFGHDRNETILQGSKLPITMRYHYYKAAYKYHKDMRIKITNGFELDGIYEAKAYDYAINTLKLENFCYWVIGNSNVLRE